MARQAVSVGYIGGGHGLVEGVTVVSLVSATHTWVGGGGKGGRVRVRVRVGV